MLQGAREFDANSRGVKLEHLRQHLPKGITALINDEIEAYARENNLIIDPKTNQGHELARRMMRAEIEAIERTIERDRGNYSGSPSDPIVKPATGTARERAKPGGSHGPVRNL